MIKRAVIAGVLAISALFALQESTASFADSTEFSIDVSDAALQLTVPPTASIELNPTTSSAVFGSTNVTINVATNNITGYRIIMSVPNTNLTHNTLSNTAIPTLSAASTESNFPANAWGYKVVGDDYEPILTSNTPASWVVEEPTNGTNHIMTLAAKVDGTKPSGDYTNILTFQAVANLNAPKDTIVYNGNGADGGSMANQQIWQGEYSKLAKNTYTRSGYLFNGWNTKNDGKGAGYGDEDNFITPATNTATTITLYAQWVEDTGQGSGNVGKTLQDAYEMAYVTNPGNFQEGGNNKHGLYVPHKTNGEYDGTYFEATKASDYEGIPANDLRFAIQDISLTIDGVKVCDYATVIGSEAYVLDLRDNKSYWITKLADGKCWMTQNLDLNLSTNILLNSTTTDLNQHGTTWYSDSDGYSVDENGVIYWQPERSMIPTTDANSSGTISSWQNMHNDPYSFDPGNWFYTDTYYRNDCSNVGTLCNYLAGGTEKFSRTPYPGNGAHGHVGNYYNWPAAIASNNSSSLSSDTATNVSNNPKNSICPKGWRLPTITDEKFTATTDENEFEKIYELYYVYDQFDVTNDRGVVYPPVWLVRGGRVWDKIIKENGAGGHYWSSTRKSNTDAYDFSFSGWTRGSDAYWSYMGHFVRCIAK